MATVTKGRTFVSGEVVTPTKLNNLVDLATVTQIVNADISATAAIADSKLAAISTAGKVSNTATTATSANTANAIVARDSSGNFSAGTVSATSFSGPLTGAVTGNASTATALQTARTIAISGDVAGTATSFNGTSDITISAAITAGAIVNADIAAAAAIADTKLATIATAGKVANSATTATSANTANAIVARDASGNFSAGTVSATSFSGPLTGAVTGNVTGNASGLSSPASNGLANAWVNFNGAGTYTLGTPTAATIRSSHNVSTITKNANGDFTVTFSSAFPNANYAVMVTAQGAANNALSVIRAGAAATMVTTTSVRVSFLDTSAGPENPNTACVVIFGNW
jgi:hypothetical protein